MTTNPTSRHSHRKKPRPATVKKVAPPPHLVLALIAVAAMIAAGWLFTRPKPLDVTVQTVGRGQVETTVINTRSGVIEACQRTKLSTITGGRIDYLGAREGERVKSGQVLMRLWQGDLRASQAVSQARLVSAQQRRLSASFRQSRRLLRPVLQPGFGRLQFLQSDVHGLRPYRPGRHLIGRKMEADALRDHGKNAKILFQRLGAGLEHIAGKKLPFRIVRPRGELPARNSGKLQNGQRRIHKQILQQKGVAAVGIVIVGHHREQGVSAPGIRPDIPQNAHYLVRRASDGVFNA